MSSETERSTAEQRFRQAFERLKLNKPTVLKAGTPVSQNNVAKEAGCDPSALRKARFPSLIREIQAYVEIHREERTSQRQQQIKRRTARADFKRRVEELETQRDHAQSQLASAHRAILELLDENQKLKMRLEELSGPSPLRRQTRLSPAQDENSGSDFRT
jgi:chromosome segregation ATPase